MDQNQYEVAINMFKRGIVETNMDFWRIGRGSYGVHAFPFLLSFSWMPAHIQLPTKKGVRCTIS